MSSMRNAVQRRNHKERAQPKEREKWGLLEKHKDYSLRAKDYNAKKARLSVLRQKAADRNPDEFYYGMLSSTSKRGRKTADRGNPILSHEAVRLLKTQDAGYLQTMIQKTRRAVERLEEEFLLRGEEDGEKVEVLGQGSGSGEKIIYVSGKDDQREWKPPLELMTAPRKLLAKADTDAKNEQVEVSNHEKQHSNARKTLAKEDQARRQELMIRKRRKKEQDARRTKLAALKAREKNLRDAENELELQRAKMANTVGGINKNGVKWKVRERKR